MKQFTEKDLTKYNGTHGKPAYIAYKGKVYVVTDSFLWKDGTHQVLHNAGKDLTNEIEQAPHSGDVLARFRVVGILQESSIHGARKTRAAEKR